MCKTLRICAIVGTMHKKSNTMYILKKFLERLQCNAGFDVNYEIFCLSEYRIDHCIGCYYCVKDNKCYIKDDMEFLKEKMLKADMIIWGTPIYMNQVSGIMKALIDRLHFWTKLMFLSGTASIVLTTSSHEGGENDVHSYMSSILCNLGSAYIGAFHFSVDAPNELYQEETENKLLDKYIGQTLANCEKYSSSADPLQECIFAELKEQAELFQTDSSHSFFIRYWKVSGMLDCSSFQEYLDHRKDEIKKRNNSQKFII